MRVSATLLLVFLTLLAKSSAAGDIYWEGEDDESNEYLEVDRHFDIGHQFRRLKREYFDDAVPTPPYETDQETMDFDEQTLSDPDDNNIEVGSGLPDQQDLDFEEKTIRVTFVVMEPYQKEYRDRDSAAFRNFSKSLAEAVNQVFREVPGTHRTSLVRIQSRPVDEFTCKVTLEIVTSGNDDTSRIADTLKEHIRNKRKLGNVAVDDSDFSFTVVYPGDEPLDSCAESEFKCIADGQCLPSEKRCDGIEDCTDGFDEIECPNIDIVRDNSTSDYESEGEDTESPADNNEGSSDSCPEGEFKCSDGQCFPDEKRCNGIEDCTDGFDEIDCLNTVCPQDSVRCDDTRCIAKSSICDGVSDCHDDTDEKDCPQLNTTQEEEVNIITTTFAPVDTTPIPNTSSTSTVTNIPEDVTFAPVDYRTTPKESCAPSDFRCYDGKCIDSQWRCNRVVDCSLGEDEQDCVCRPDEFRCNDDGTCIEDRKRCDGTSHCADSSDEIDCACSSNHWQCDHGSCIKLNKRCDGRVDCPTDRSDERNCVASGFFKCRSGKLIPEYQRCNRRYDCDPGDYSDEKNCPCGDGDFKCGNGHCIPASKQCDRTHDCQDGSDERDCSYGNECMAYQYKCASGQCVPAESRCNGTKECIDGSDERNCPCKRDEFRCRSGLCVNIAMRCNGYKDCQPLGEDEFNCEPQECSAGSFTCNSGSSVRCATKCNDVPECDAGEDEEDCPECAHVCDGDVTCLDASQVCDDVPDCKDGSDEDSCPLCNGPNDFRCDSGECINRSLRCNNVTECEDASDEYNCEIIVTPSPSVCNPREFQCRDGTCINSDFVCDERADCNDKSDEENCRCKEGFWQCSSGQCIPERERCDGVINCRDRTDEQECYPITTDYPDPPYIPRTDYPIGYNPVRTSPTTQRPPFTTTPFYYPDLGCGRYQWRCENGPCIDSRRRCDGHVDCPRDGSDEFDCPPGSPVALNLRIHPENQTMRVGGDIVISCRDEGDVRADVRWVREGGRPLKSSATDVKGRLEIFQVTPLDSGVYICQAPMYLGTPGSEVRATVVVENKPIIQRPEMKVCAPTEATCGNGQCIPKSALCDDRVDCADRSDEVNCGYNGSCQPNQFICNNRKCVLKTWICDSEDDCGDGSDEICDPPLADQQCRSTEFECRSGDQCVPKSFHCDGQSDCLDKSDEVGCVSVVIIKPPYPSQMKMLTGETLTLSCEATGMPMPLISWRLNWGHVPAKCHSTSQNGVGVLTCPDMQPEDSGAYSCEGLNVKGTVFAVPDAIVHVERETTTCPSGYFNSEARSPNECIRCFCFGKTTDCRSADLFTYSMPTPLGRGGTRLSGVKQDYSGEVQIDEQQINDQYYYQPLQNGATVTKLRLANSAWSRSNGPHPYLTLPETYNGNRLTSYGGHIKYRLLPHNPSRYESGDNIADIIIMGKYQNLIHVHTGDRSRETYIDARLTPEYWQRPGSDGLIPASREDIMMALDDVKVILLRADFNNAGVNISDFVMESAKDVNVGLGLASLVEECSCPEGYKGLSCQECTDDFVRVQSDRWLGSCVRKRPCPPLTYGDPSSGGDCKPCPCPLTNRGNQFARTCSVGPSGNVICDCLPGYEGEDCSYCAENYYGNPLIPGDSCQPKPSDNCNTVGTSQVRLPDECVCKENVQGRYCDQCKNGTFHLSNDFRHGCAGCFCTGVTQNCVVSNLSRKKTAVRFNVPQIVDQVNVYKTAPSTSGGSVRYNAPIETDLEPQLVSGAITVGNIARSLPAIYYWSLPASFAGDKVTSYGGYLTYELNNVLYSGENSVTNAADVQLISDNSLTFHYFGNFMPDSSGYLNAQVQFLENGWQRSDGKPVSREHFLLALADVKTILIKATYAMRPEIASIISASIETAEPYGDGPVALHVEQCMCPTGYVGTSCEDCAPGYTRKSSGLYLEHCGVCDCNGHSDLCHPETGVCYNCADNTDGANCESCKDGYNKDEYNNCVPSNYVSPTPCSCDPRGEDRPCDSSGYCYCKTNVEGQNCDRCRPGTFGLDASNPMGCLSCYCSGVTNNCQEANHYNKIPIAAPMFGDNYGGYTLMTINADQVINDQFVPAPNESELMYIFSTPPNEELYWSLPAFPGNRVLSYGSTLSITQKFETGGYPRQSTPGTDVILVGDTHSVYWSNPTTIMSNQDVSYQVPLNEDQWYILNSGQPASRQEFMSVLKNIQRVLVRATLSQNITLTAISDVYMDTATENYDPNLPPAKGIEICVCPRGYTGTSCETCTTGYYRDQNEYCRQCECNGHACQLGAYGEVVCNCRPPYTGANCSTIGLVMELHPNIRENYPNSTKVGVTFTCKYRAPEPLTIKFYFMGQEMKPAKYYNESQYSKEGWRGEHSWHTVWDTRQLGEVYECHTITEKGFTLGVLSTTLPEKETAVYTTTTPRPLGPDSRVVVRIMNPSLEIREIGSSVQFTCQARSRMTPTVQLTWEKADGNLPQERTIINEDTGVILITNLQRSDSGVYICRASDGMSTNLAQTTLKVPGTKMTAPTASISPAFKEYYEGDRVQLTCATSGNPAPQISWQRASNRPLPRSMEIYDSLLVIENANVEDAGEYRCIASNTAGNTYSTAVVQIRPRPGTPQQQKLIVSSPEPNVYEGQNIQIVCTGTPDIPVGGIVWVRQDGKDLLSNAKSDNGVLYIKYAQIENQGIYICQSPYNIHPVTIVLTVLSTNTPSPDEASNITVSLKRLEIPTGGSKTVECSPTGYPLPLIKWSKYQGTFGPVTSQRGNTLIISNAQPSDEGYYICEGSVDGRIISTAYVYVGIEKREPPRVEIYPRGENFVTLGTQYDLHCRVMGGIPTPVVTWGRNLRPLSPHVQILQNNVLRFQTTEVNDEGEYTCTATNEAGSVSDTAIFKVRSPPEITITPNIYNQVTQGDRVVIECRADGYPEPEVSIKSRMGYQVLVPPAPRLAVLTIPSVSDRDDSDYICTATSPAGTTEEPFTIRVDSDDIRIGSEEGSGEPFDENVRNITNDNSQPSNLIAIQGQETRIGCNTSNEFKVFWERGDGMDLQDNAMQSGSELIIYNTSKSDAGRYVCSNVNKRTQEVQQAATISLQVIAEPRVTILPQKQIVSPGESPIVECHVEGDDIISVSWRPLDTNPSNRVEIKHTILMFHKIEVEDAGRYECFANNRVGNATSVAEVVVSEDSDRVASESHDNEQFAHVGAVVHLSCNISTRGLSIHWTKNGKPLPRSVSQKNDGSIFIRNAQKSDSGYYVCNIYNQKGRQTSNYINLHIEGPRVPTQSLIAIDQPRRPFRVGEKVEVLCRTRSREIEVKWERYGTNQFVESIVYGDGAVLVISNVQPSDAAVYRCIGQDRYGRQSYFDNFTLEVTPGSVDPVYPVNDKDTIFTARLGDTVDLPCRHNLESADVEWRREYSQLPANIRHEPNLHLESVTDADAGTYICRVTNNRARVETHATLRVVGVIPKFQGDGWLTLPPLKDTYLKFNIEIAFKPADANGIILYTGEKEDGTGDYILLQLIDGVPVFTLKFDASEPLVISGNRPLQLNAWHTIRLGKSSYTVTMDVDNTEPFTAELANQYEVLDLNLPLYIGDAPPLQLKDENGYQDIETSTGFVGCVSMLILGTDDINIMARSIDRVNVKDCDSCTPNLCLNNGVCQEARNELGYTCICPARFAGTNCARTGDACRPDLCGPGKCTDTAKGYKCACPVTFTGKNCEIKQNIDYPAFTGSAYLAIKPPKTSRYLLLSMKIKARPPVTDGIIMYCAQSARGYGGFTSLTVHNSRLEFRYDLGDGSDPTVLISNTTLIPNEWTDVQIARVGNSAKLKIDLIHSYEATLASPKELNLETPMFVGGVDDSIVLNNNTGVTGGFSGCIKDVILHGYRLDLINASIQSANVQDCVDYQRGDIPEIDGVCSLCRNEGYCLNPDATSCTCPSEYTGTYCETRVSYPNNRRQYRDPCAVQPCRNGGMCKADLAARMLARSYNNYTCDCPFGYAGTNCQMRLELLESVGFNGNGYLELPASYLRYDQLHREPAIAALAFHTTNDGVLLYQKEGQQNSYIGDFIMLRVDRGFVVMEWDLGSGLNKLMSDVMVTDGVRHNVILKLFEDNRVTLEVDEDQKVGTTNGLSNVMNADSNIYIGGIPESLKRNMDVSYPGLIGCIEQVEFYESRSLILGNVAVAGRNTQRCKDVPKVA